MGQCVSRSNAGPYALIRRQESGSLASSIHYAHPRNNGWRGQSDSKGAKKKSGGKTTKGVTTSFGFRRRPASSSRADDNLRRADSNGNGGSTEELYTGADALSGRSTPLARPRKESSGVPLRTNRFGFRQPSSSKTAKVGDVNLAAEQAFNITTKDKESKFNNNAFDKTSTNATYNLPLPHIATQVASTGSTTVVGATGLPKTVTKQTVILTYQPQQISTGNQYNRSAGNTGAGAARNSDNTGYGGGGQRSSSASRAHIAQEGQKTVGKYTFQTNQLPRPQYPAVKLLDNKTAKQVANNSRKVSGSSDGSSREGSATDSGVSTAGECYASGGEGGESPRMHRRRPRNLEMVMKGAHSFHLRELNVYDLDIMDEAVVTEVAVIPLPKLPSTFDSDRQEELKVSSYTVPPALTIQRPASSVVDEPPEPHSPVSTLERYRARTRERASRQLVAEGRDEEKFVLDRAQPERPDKRSPFVKCRSGLGSPASKETSPSCESEGRFDPSTEPWNDAAGEAMATRSQDDVSLAFSTSSVEEDRSKKSSPTAAAPNDVPQKTIVIADEDTPPHPLLMKSMTISQHDAIRSMMMGSMSSSNYSGLSTSTTSDTNNITLAIDESKFDLAAMEAEMLIDDETSPADSLISSSSDDDLADIRAIQSLSSAYQTANTKTESKDDADGLQVVKEPEKAASKNVSPQSPGTPTNASGSLSLSDGRDYFDDEIADQPGLLLRKSNEDSPSGKAVTESETQKQLRRSREKITASPLSQKNRKFPGSRGAAERTPSLDTLSSLASDDMMMENELGLSVTSLQSVDDYIERLDSSYRSGLNSLDERQLRQELSSSKLCAVNQWNQLLEQNSVLDRQLAAMAHGKPSDSASSSLTNIAASLPVRTARLLQRSRAHTPSSDAGASASDGGGGNGAGGGGASPAPASLLQDVVDIKTLLLQLKRVLHEPGEEHHSTSSETLDPLLLACADGPARGNGRRLPPHPAADSPLHPRADHTADLKRQILYLQSQVEERDRLVRVLQRQMCKLSDVGAAGDVTGHATVVAEDTCNVATQTERLRPPVAANLTNSDNSGLVRLLADLFGFIHSKFLRRRDTLSSLPSLETPADSYEHISYVVQIPRLYSFMAHWNEANRRKLSTYSEAQKTTRAVVNGSAPAPAPAPVCAKCASACGARRADGPADNTGPHLEVNGHVVSRYLRAITGKEQAKRDLSVSERPLRRGALDCSRSRSIENFQNQNLSTEKRSDGTFRYEIKHHTSHSDLYRGHARTEVEANGHSPVSGTGQSTESDYSSDGGYKSLPSSINGNGAGPRKTSGIPRRSVESRLFSARPSMKASAI